MTAGDAPLLSICIATLNRANVIGETLEALLAGAPDGVEVVVLDGGSMDGTDALIAGFQQQYPSLRYVRQDKAHGVDQDFDAAVQHARGDYCWLMSDDDLLKPGGLQRVLDEIARGYDLIVVNAEARTTDLSEVLIPRLMKLAEDHHYGPQDIDRLMAETGSYLTFIGGVVIRRSLWNARERQRYYGSLFIHVGVIFQATIDRALAIADPLIVIRYGNAQWTARGFEIWLFKWPSLVWSFPAIGAAAKELVSPRQPWRRATTLMLFRAKGAYAVADYRRWLRRECPSALERAKLWAIAVSPGPVVNALVSLYLKLRHPEPGVALFELRHSRFHHRAVLSRISRAFAGKA